MIYHGFWAVPEELYAQERLSFFKNVALMGGLLMIAVHGPGRFSLDAWHPAGTAALPAGRNRTTGPYARYY